MQETTNIGLKTYEASDPTDWLADFNYNMNKIDESVGTQNTSIATVTSTANQANSTATLANTTANSALTTANSKASIDDLASSDSTTYSSEKIDELIAGAGGAVIDDTTTSLNSTWSSTKINTEIEAVETIANSKASINDSTASATTTYSSNKNNTLYCKKPNYASTESITGTTNDLYSRAFYDFGHNMPEGWYRLTFGCSAKTDSAPNDFTYVDLTIKNQSSLVTSFRTEDVTQHYSSGHFPVISYNSPLFYITGGQISCEVKFDVRTTTDHKPSIMSCVLTRINPVE